MSWEFRLSNLYDSLTSHLQIISRYEVLSKSFPQKTQEAEVIDIEKKNHIAFLFQHKEFFVF